MRTCARGAGGAPGRVVILGVSTIGDAMTLEGVILLIVFCAVLVAFGLIIRLLYRMLRVGRYENRFDRWGARVRAVLVFVGGQARVLAQPAGIGHFLIFWGFIFITLGTAEHILGTIIPAFSYELILGSRVAAAIYWLQDIFGILVIGAVIVAAFRRFVLRPERLKIDDPKAPVEGGAILGLIFVLIVLMYGFRGTSILLGRHTMSAAVTPVSHYAADFMSGWGVVGTAHHVFSWGHHLIIFFFLLYIPFSKHIHILGAIPNVFFKNLGAMGTLGRMDFEDETVEKFGISEIQEYTWKQLMDLYACTECGRCQVACPAYLTEKPLSPYRVIHHLRGHLMDRRRTLLDRSSGGEDEKENEAGIIPGTVTEDEIWACTTCGACMQECPPFIEHVQKLVDLRRYLVMTESRFPSEMQQVFRNMEVNYNPWALGFSQRADWAEGLDVPVASEKQGFDVLYWVGCAGSFDARGQSVSRAMIELMRRAGVDFAILGVEEMCCGETARRMGNEYLAETLINGNIEILKKYEFREIVTACPHGYNTFKVEYPQFGFSTPVVHHTEFLLRLVREGRLAVPGMDDMRGAYHDSCYLGRYNGILRPPRELLAGTVGKLAEFGRRGKRSFCCGAGGGRMWMEETLGRRINEERVDESLGLGVDHVFTACPFCMTMFEDGLKAREREDVKVLDVAEVVLRAVGGA
jgi:Fe-S oxidoreductase